MFFTNMFIFLLILMFKNIGFVFSLGEMKGTELQVCVFPVEILGTEVRFLAWIVIWFVSVEL